MDKCTNHTHYPDHLHYLPLFTMYYFTIFLTDLGANIGAFTLAVAAMGRKVKAVDAGFENLSYMRYI
jgi:hypothetical protein